MPGIVGRSKNGLGCSQTLKTLQENSDEHNLCNKGFKFSVKSNRSKKKKKKRILVPKKL